MEAGWTAGEECGLPPRSRWRASSSLSELFRDTHMLYNKLCEQCRVPVQVFAQSFGVWVKPQSAGEWQISDTATQSTPTRTGALLCRALWRLKGVPHWVGGLSILARKVRQNFSPRSWERMSLSKRTRISTNLWGKPILDKRWFHLQGKSAKVVSLSFFLQFLWRYYFSLSSYTDRFKFWLG